MSVFFCFLVVIAPKVHIPLSRVSRLFSRGSGNGGQNLHASHSRCLLKFNINSADWLPLRVRESFIRNNGQFISPKGTVVIVREDTRSPADNEKLAVGQLQAMLDKALEAAEDARPAETVHVTEQERIKSTKTNAQIQRYRDTMRMEKRIRSETKRNRKAFFDE